MSKNIKILDGHKKEGNKFIPPAKHLLNLSEISWTNDLLPELIWLGVLVQKLGLKKGIEYSSFMIATATEFSKSEKHFDFAFISSFRFLTSDETSALITKLKENKYYDELVDTLQNFINLYPENNPISFFVNSNISFDKSVAIKEFKEILTDCFNRHSKLATIIQTIVPYSKMRAGKLYYTANVEPPDYNAIVEDFESDNAKKAAGSARAFVNSNYGHIEDTITKEWAKYFWNNGLILEKLIIRSVTDKKFEYQGDDEFFCQIVKYEQYVDLALIKRWNAIPKDIYEHQVIEVLGAVLARQATLAKRIARNPENWDFHIGPILLRAMIDLHITLAWILTDPNSVTKKFIMYGLGQEKLKIEHFEDQNGSNEDKPLLDIMIEASKSWLSDQRYSFLTTVDVGSWTGHSTRDIAEKAGCRDLYRFAYSPFSSCTHSMWNHIGKFNVRFSDNALHKHLRIPFDPDIPPQSETLINSAKYLLKTFNAIDNYYELESDDFNPVEFWYKFFESTPAGESGITSGSS
ncbi:MAG: hypothetical protein AMXMBFR51_30160 [Ignavibacteriota bacterium]